MARTVDAMRTSDRICSTAHAAFENLPRGRPQLHEWTVLAAFVALVRRGAVEDTAVIALATGNKCIGVRDMRDDGSVLNDSHAETLARRALKYYLLREVAEHRRLCTRSSTVMEATAQGIDKCSFGMLSHDTSAAAGSFRLRPEVTLHLYISDSPCGDAAIYDDGVVVSQSQGYRRTGAKLTDVSGVSETSAGAAAASLPLPSSSMQQLQLGAVRTKPGRSDLPADKVTTSMSCSDKIARWTCVAAGGLTGAMLAHELAEPLALSSIVVSAGEEAAAAPQRQEQQQQQQEARDGAVAPSTATHVFCDGVDIERCPPQLKALVRALITRVLPARVSVDAAAARVRGNGGANATVDIDVAVPLLEGAVTDGASIASNRGTKGGMMSSTADSCTISTSFVPLTSFACAMSSKASIYEGVAEPLSVVTCPLPLLVSLSPVRFAAGRAARSICKTRHHVETREFATQDDMSRPRLVDGHGGNGRKRGRSDELAEARSSTQQSHAATPSFTSVNAVAGAHVITFENVPIPGGRSCRAGPDLSVEVTIAATGLLQGAARNSPTAVSRLCKRELLRLFASIHTRCDSGVNCASSHAYASIKHGTCCTGECATRAALVHDSRRSFSLTPPFNGWTHALPSRETFMLRDVTGNASRNGNLSYS